MDQHPSGTGSSAAPESTERALHQAALAASQAPSVHNTQPWSFALTGGALEIRADLERTLAVLDPERRQLQLSLGCAVMNARVALAAAGLSADVARLPDPADPTLVARITVVDGDGDEALAALEPSIERRRSNRRRFEPEPVPEAALLDLESAAAAESATVHALRDEDSRVAAAVLSQRADELQQADPAYRAELHAWTGGDPQRRDGVPYSAVPLADGTAHDDIPIRQFDSDGLGGLPAGTESSARQCLVVLSARSEQPEQWLRVGEALERLWLEATRLGYALSPLTQVVEIPHIRAQLRAELRTEAWPCVMVRIGRAPDTPATRRRELADVLR